MIIHGTLERVEFSANGHDWAPLPPFDGATEREAPATHKPITLPRTEPADLAIDWTNSTAHLNRFYRTLRRLTQRPGIRGTSPRRSARRRHNRKLKQH